ncbi:hypothetical protein QUF58_01690 [Anaerolineales bacterium HSG24]|nr:hypothetical protein [Anaerolineales bacterium HSG24]
MAILLIMTTACATELASPTEVSMADNIPTPSATPLPDTTTSIPSPTTTPTNTPSPSSSPTPTQTTTPTNTSSPSSSPSPTPTQTTTPTNTSAVTSTPTPTIDLASCTINGCKPNQTVEPLPYLGHRLLLNTGDHDRRTCRECAFNPVYSERELAQLMAADAETLALLQEIVLSQRAYSLTPGVVYIMFDEAHHVVVDLEQTGYRLRNIIPPFLDERRREDVRITPSYCLTPDSLMVLTADYHGLNGSNKTETGREVFFHQGRAELFQRKGQFDLDVLTKEADFSETSISWGGGPIFMWDGRYNYNPKQEWFTPAALTHYKMTRWAKVSAAISKDRKYLFLSISYDKSLFQHTHNIIGLGRRWGIKVDRAMRFDGSESAYMALRLGDYMVPLLHLEEPIIVNCLAIESP